MLSHMASSLHRTTVYLDPHELALIGRAAREQRRTTAALIREALRLYARRLQPTRLQSEGCVRGRRRDLAEQDEQVLRDAFRRRR